jgi:hypothetical protein
MILFSHFNLIQKLPVLPFFPLKIRFFAVYGFYTF